ncbi:lycopene cyclase family protein [Paraflavitalea sp. CAU 1676]|uniref:lycopene cyclase family protein n=1 Tax=Paraflavitalea sp. CAU 1676 TaxID=3032598 RepID=UPI0023DA52BB|nr:lycopene cyclase family protein [Paraflavitalea sp. CAU 1676]MDF2187161.1 lycopene cyclase family protein [Paraflavitalea sp. CAU 1676]
MNRYDYIIAGAGCAGLSFLVRLLQTEQYNQQKILLIDRAPKTTNDRTWCFWEKEAGYFDAIVYKKWQQLWFNHPTFSTRYSIEPYSYKMIRAIDFYQYSFSVVDKYPNVTIVYEPIEAISHVEGGAVVQTANTSYFAPRVFSSVLPGKPVLKKNQYYLLQHFKGWRIRTPQAMFNPTEATLMDFRIPQKKGTAFVYVMPFTEQEALIEYTLFSEQLLTTPEYDAGLTDYLHRVLGITDYTIEEEEFGAIPMTNYRYPVSDGAITYLGTAGGQTKPSTGYTFQFIQKQTASLVTMMDERQPATEKHLQHHRRFHWYDATLLNILAHKKLPGDIIFKELFKNNRITDILQFLDNETSLFQEMRIITVLPKRVFLRAACQQLF